MHGRAYEVRQDNDKGFLSPKVLLTTQTIVWVRVGTFQGTDRPTDRTPRHQTAPRGWGTPGVTCTTFLAEEGKSAGTCWGGA